MDKTVFYLTLQATAEGQAAHAHVNEIVLGLRRRGWEIRLFEPRYRRGPERVGSFRRVIEFIRVQLRFIPRLRMADALYIRWHAATIPSAWSARIFRVPIVVEVNGAYGDLFVSWPWTRRIAPLARWMMRSQLRSADLVVAVTEELADWVRSQAPGRTVAVVRNGANTDLFRPEAEDTFNLPKPYVAFVGALAPWQGIDTILAAVRSGTWPHGVSIAIAGDGPMRERIEGTDDPAVIYLGRIPYHSVPSLLAHSLAGISVQTDLQGRGRTGLFPLKVFETLACGIPAIVSDFPGQADLIRDGECGIVIPPGDSEALARAVAYLHENPTIRDAMGERGRRLVVSAHSWDARAEEIDAILTEVVERRG